MTTISLPKVTLNILGASSVVQNAEQKILFVGQKTGAGSATSGSLVEDITDANISTLFGADSMLAQMLRAAKAINGVTKMDAIPLDDNGAGVAATGSLSFVGNATADGTYTVYVGSKTNGSYSLAVTSGDSADDVGTALAAAITADTKAPVDAANVGGVVTFTAVNDGTEGNFIGIEVDGTVSGLTYTISGMASGATNPSLTDVFDPIDGIRYQTIVFPASYGLTELKAEMQSRFNVDNKVLDGIAVLTATNTYALLVSTYTSENEKSICVLGNEKVDDSDSKGSAIFELNTVISSQFAALRALRLTTDVSIAEITIAGTNGARDSFGGDAIRSLPYFNTPFNNLVILESGKGFTETEIDGLKTAGMSTLGNNVARNTVILGEMVTLYKTDAAGNPDNSFKYLNFVDTMSGIREYYFNNLKSRFAQSRLTEGEVLPRRNMANEQVIRGFCTKLYNDLAGEDYVLTQAGETALNFYKNNLSVILDLENRKVTLTMKVPIVTQLANIIGSVQLSFDTN